jgi:hypothetical protein
LREREKKVEEITGILPFNITNEEPSLLKGKRR